MRSLIEHFGYLAILLGTFIEGETFLMLGSYAAHRGYLHVPGVMISGFVAAMASDHLWFYLGRRQGARVLARYPRVAEKVRALLGRIERHGTPLVLATRFLWGMRIALPVAVGTSAMPYRKFLVLTAVSSAVWATAVVLIGYGASQLLASLATQWHRQEHLVFAILAALAVVIIAWRWRPRRETG